MRNFGRFLIGALATISFGIICHGQTVTIEVETAGFDNATSTGGVNGMPWGLVVDTSDFGLGSLASGLEPFAFPLQDAQVELGVNGLASTGLIFARSGSDTEDGPPPSFSSGYMNDIVVSTTGVLSSGQDYGIIWFASESASGGDAFGFINPGLQLPSDGSTVNISSSVSSAGADFNVIPEPSAYATILGLLGLGYAVFCRRRRSSSTD